MCYLAVTVSFLFFVFYLCAETRKKNQNPFKASIPKVQGE